MGEGVKTIAPKFSLLEEVANQDKTELFFRNVAMRQIRDQGLWPEADQEEAPQQVDQQRQPPPPVLQRALQEQVGHPQNQEPDHDPEGESTVTEFSRLNQYCCKHKTKKVKSGFLDKPDTNVQHKVLVPHMAQNRCFMHKPVTFEKLSFECFVAGEAHIIEKCTNASEMVGRLKLLQRVCYWKAGGAPWHKVRSMYQAILRMIEDEEMPWSLLLYQFDPLMNIDYDQIMGNKIPHKKWQRSEV